MESWVRLQGHHIADMKYSAHAEDHLGWMKCDGRSLSRDEYADLFAIVGTSFGSDNATTFNLPDIRGRVPGAVGNGSGLTSRSLGQTTGTETHTLTVAQMPSHAHTITDPGHTHSYVNNTNDQNTDNAFASETAADQADLSATTGSSTTGITVNNNGGGNAFNIMQPTLFIGNLFIYAKLDNLNFYKDSILV
jgi:microcystin-dependent protein